MEILISKSHKNSNIHAVASNIPKFYCDIITRSHLQLINTSIDTFFSKLRAFLAEQRKKRRPVMEKEARGAVDNSLADHKTRKSDTTVHNLWKIWRPAPSGMGSYGWLMKFGRGLKF